MKEYPMYIGGKAVSTDHTFEVINPATSEPFARCSAGTAEHVDLAVQAAQEAFISWGKKSDDERRAGCMALADALEANMKELMELVTMESGKPFEGLNGVGSGMEVGGSIGWTRATASFELPVELIQDNDEARIEVHRKPLGVVGSITPWNWPLLIAIWHVIPAIRAGNTVVIKPSSFTPVATTRMVELANQVLPAGVLNIVTGEGGVGSAITKHPGVSKIVFTGSTPTGRRIMEASAANLKRLTLELGGNDAGIVLPDVNVKEIASKLFGVSFHNNGQTCAALKRLYVHEDIHDELAQEIAQIAKETIVGNGLNEGTQLGPVQNADQLKVVEDLAASVEAQGGTIVAGGNKIAGNGYFFEPTIVTGLTNGSRLVDEEPFGPILPIIKFSTIEEAVRLANDSENGLGGSVWSNDIDKASKIAMQLECGTSWVNEHGAIQPDAPFGGVKQSGFGVEFGTQGLKEFTHIQTLKVMK